MSRMKGNDCFYCVKTRENARNFARRKSATAGIRVGALLSQICDCRAQRVNRVADREISCQFLIASYHNEFIHQNKDMH